MNKPVTMMGFQSMEFFMLFLLLIGIAFLSYTTGGLLFSIVFIVLYLLIVIKIGNKIKVENRKGNPNFLKGYIDSGAYPKCITDKYSFLRLISFFKLLRK